MIEAVAELRLENRSFAAVFQLFRTAGWDSDSKRQKIGIAERPTEFELAGFGIMRNLRFRSGCMIRCAENSRS